MKYKAIFKPYNSSSIKVIKVCDTREEAIEECVNYRYNYYNCDQKQERREGLSLRGWCIIGYSGNELAIEEVES